MRTLLVFLLILLLALGLAALLSPVLMMWQDGDTQPHQIITHSAKLIAIPFVILGVRWLGVRTWAAVGFNLPAGRFWWELAKGWMAGFIVMIALAGYLVLIEARVMRPVDDNYWFDLARSALLGLLGGLLVGFVEETFVRGAMYASMSRELALKWVVVLSSVYFAGLHFIRPQPLAAEAADVWWSGLVMVAGAFGAFAQPGSIIDSFAALFMAGVFLSLLRSWRGNLAYVIGMHAGWVMAIKLAKSHTWLLTDSSSHWAIGSYDKITGWLACIWLLVLSGALMLVMHRAGRKLDRSN